MMILRLKMLYHPEKFLGKIFRQMMWIIVEKCLQRVSLQLKM